MEEDFESARNDQGARTVLQRRQGITEEQHRELSERERPIMKVVFRRSKEEERLVSLLNKQIDPHD